jgi:hypothetical protein
LSANDTATGARYGLAGVWPAVSTGNSSSNAPAVRLIPPGARMNGTPSATQAKGRPPNANGSASKRCSVVVFVSREDETLNVRELLSDESVECDALSDVVTVADRLTVKLREGVVL